MTIIIIFGIWYGLFIPCAIMFKIYDIGFVVYFLVNMLVCVLANLACYFHILYIVKKFDPEQYRTIRRDMFMTRMPPREVDSDALEIEAVIKDYQEKSYGFSDFTPSPLGFT